MGLAVPDSLLARGALVWTPLFGAISFEVFGQYGADTFAAPDGLFAHHLAVLADLADLAPRRAVRRAGRRRNSGSEWPPVFQAARFPLLPPGGAR